MLNMLSPSIKTVPDPCEGRNSSWHELLADGDVVMDDNAKRFCRVNIKRVISMSALDGVGRLRGDCAPEHCASAA